MSHREITESPWKAMSFIRKVEVLRVTPNTPLLVIGLLSYAMEGTEPPTASLSGQIRGNCLNCWCKLDALFLENRYFAEVEETGSFKFDFVFAGTYAFVCLQGAKPFAQTSVVVVNGVKPLEIQAPGSQ